METIEVTRSGGVVTITLNRPQVKNALNGQMWIELRDTLTAIRDSDDDRAVVITGANGEFCSGADLSGRADGPPPRHGLANMRIVNDVALLLHRLPQPVVAKVDGVAVGAGCNLALGCDLIVASDRARFSQIFVRRGLSVDFGGTWLLPRLVGLHRAKQLALLGDILSAAEAQALGLVNAVVPVAELDAFVDGWATRLAGGPPIAMAQTKKMLNESLFHSMHDALEAEAAAQTVNFGTADTGEAIAAFLQKRTPSFKGR
ncbi:MAG: enoyl-CoA hydratase/isomerase family protein [Acidimicrobiales bacterium]